MRAIRAISRADVALLVVDATEPLTAQDQHIAGYVQEAGKGMIVLVNKWDLVEKAPTTMNEYAALARRERSGCAAEVTQADAPMVSAMNL